VSGGGGGGSPMEDDRVAAGGVDAGTGAGAGVDTWLSRSAINSASVCMYSAWHSPLGLSLDPGMALSCCVCAESRFSLFKDGVVEVVEEGDTTTSGSRSSLCILRSTIFSS